MKYRILFLLSIISICGHAQYYQKLNESGQRNYVPRQVTIELSPVVIQYGKYYFNDRRVKFEEIKLPLIAVNDKKIDHKLKVINTLNDFRRVVGFGPLIVTTALAGVLPNASKRTLTDYLYIMWGAVGLNLLYDLSITLMKRNTINRYNKVIVQPSASVLPSNGVNLGLSIKF